MLTCREMTELVTDYLDRRLPTRRRFAFRLHLGLCPRCRAYLQQMKATVRALARLEAEPAPAAARAQLLARFRAAVPRSSAAAVPGTVRLLAALEETVGGLRGWAFAALLLLAAVLALPALGLQPGPLAHGADCLATELFAGLLPAAALLGLAAAKHARLSAGILVAGGMAGGLAAFVLLQATCPAKHFSPHVLAFHVGGMIAAGVASLALSRLPSLR